nr:hypothetical protein [Pontibacter liquoris]
MVPDALLLELHPHTHTIDTANTDHHKAQIASKHSHCPVEDLFGASFQGSITAWAALPVLAPAVVYTFPYTCSPHKTTPATPALRGPPLA